MDAKQTRRAVLDVLEQWKSLSLEQKGIDFQKSVERLETWARELEKRLSSQN